MFMPTATPSITSPEDYWVSVSANVVCVTCDMQAPRIGDAGHLGYPSLDDRATCHGELASFEHLYRGFAAIGYLPYHLEALRSFLTEHGQHDVGLFLEGDEYAGRFPPLTTAPSKTFQFADGRFVDAVFELACKRCGLTFYTDVERVRPLESWTVPKKHVEEFFSRVLDSDPLNFHRLSGLLDPQDPAAERLNEFLREHRKHSLTARTIGEEEWSAPPLPLLSPASSAPLTGPISSERREFFWTAANVMPHPAATAPPLKLAWSYEHVQPWPVLLVADGDIYTSGVHQEALVCLTPDGIERWRVDLGRHYAIGGARGVAVLGDHLAAGLFSADQNARELLLINRRTGAVEQRMPFPFFYLAPVPGQARFVGYRVEYGSRESALALFDLSDLTHPAWQHVISLDGTSDRSFDHFAIDAGVMYTEWGGNLVAMRLTDGEVIWRRPLLEFDGRGMVSGDQPPAVANGTLLLSTRAGLIAFDTADGSERWRRPIASWARVVCDGMIYVTAAGECVAVFDLATGEEVRSIYAVSEPFTRTLAPKPEFVGLPVISRTHVFVSGSQGRIWALEQSSLTPEWMIRLARPAFPALAYGHRLLATNRSLLQCFEPA
jgi:hypothetical protein